MVIYVSHDFDTLMRLLRKDVAGGFQIENNFSNVVRLHVCSSLSSLCWFILCYCEFLLSLAYSFAPTKFLKGELHLIQLLSMFPQGSAKNLPSSCTSKMRPELVSMSVMLLILSNLPLICFILIIVSSRCCSVSSRNM